jgi:predicted metal-dependent phosphoesterase TrpH
MIANLHLHSKFSDGSQWPEEVALAAFNEGLELAALTDHDTFGGSARFTEEFARLGKQGLTACEIDVSAPEVDYKSEILAYFPGKSVPECKAVGAILAGVLKERRKRLEYYLYWARTIFRRSDLTLESLAADKLGGKALKLVDLDAISWNKVDLFLYLKKKELIPPQTGYKHFKRDWFVPGRFPKYKLEKPDLASLVRAIHSDGGFAVVPHVGHLWNDEVEVLEEDGGKFDALLAWFSSIGVDGLEMYWYSGKKKTEALNAAAKKKAERLGFFLTYGSDCHGPGTDKKTIDLFSGDFPGFPTALRR